MRGWRAAAGTRSDPTLFTRCLKLPEEPDLDQDSDLVIVCSGVYVWSSARRYYPFTAAARLTANQVPLAAALAPPSGSGTEPGSTYRRC